MTGCIQVEFCANFNRDSIFYMSMYIVQSIYAKFLDEMHILRYTEQHADIVIIDPLPPPSSIKYPLKCASLQ